MSGNRDFSGESDAFKVGWAQQTIHALIEGVGDDRLDNGVRLTVREWSSLIRLAEVLGPPESTS